MTEGPRRIAPSISKHIAASGFIPFLPFVPLVSSRYRLHVMFRPPSPEIAFNGST
jgi:hypothetical protein